MEGFIKTWDQYPHKFNFGHLFSSPLTRDTPVNKLRVTIKYPYELSFLHELRITLYIRFKSYFLFRKLWVTFMARVTSYLLLDLYELLFITKVTSCFLHTSYGLLFIPRVTCYLLTMSYNKDEDYKAVYNNKVMIKNYFLGSLFIKNLGFAEPCFPVISMYSRQRKNLFSTLWYLYKSFMYDIQPIIVLEIFCIVTHRQPLF